MSVDYSWNHYDAISGLRLGGIPRRVLALKSTLRHLYLHRCGIGSDFPHQLIVLINLQTLDLSENGITYLPDSFCITGMLPSTSIAINLYAILLTLPYASCFSQVSSSLGYEL